MRGFQSNELPTLYAFIVVRQNILAAYTRKKTHRNIRNASHSHLKARARLPALPIRVQQYQIQTQHDSDGQLSEILNMCPIAINKFVSNKFGTHQNVVCKF